MKSDFLGLILIELSWPAISAKSEREISLNNIKLMMNAPYKNKYLRQLKLKYTKHVHTKASFCSTSP